MVQDKLMMREPGCSVGLSLGQNMMVVHCIPLSVISISDCSYDMVKFYTYYANR